MSGRRMGFVRRFLPVVVCLLLGFAPAAQAQVASGYSEYYIPGDENKIYTILNTLDTATASPTHSVISVVTWSDTTTVYYDHWENCKGTAVGSPGCASGYNFDPADPGNTADETYTLATAGAQKIFESASIPSNPRGTSQYYDGGDRIYVAGGAVTVARAAWIESTGSGNQSAAWEIYPIKPQLTTYILPFGEDLYAADPANNIAFQRVFVLVQATADNTTVQLDFNGDGTVDTFCIDKTRASCGVANQGTSVSLDKGETFMVDNWVAQLQGAPYNVIHSGNVIKGASTLQVKFIAGQDNAGYCARGFSAFPRGFWTKDYYAPLNNLTTNGTGVDYFLYNPNAAAMVVTWETDNGTGTITIPANATVSARANAFTPSTTSGTYFKSNDIFWGVGLGDRTGATYEWGFSLLPSTMLYQEHFFGWAPGSRDVTTGLPDTTGNPGNQDNDGVFLIAAQDNTRVYVDFNNDGVADLIDANLDGTPESPYVSLNRLQTQYFYDPTNGVGGGDLSQAHFWATGPFTMAYGENANRATTANPSLDLGYVAIPGTDFISLVLTVDKTADPEVIGTASGSTADFTLQVDSQKYTVDGVQVVDYLPANWAYAGPTSITLPDRRTISTAPTETLPGADLPGSIGGTCPTGGGNCLSWDSSVLGSMLENQSITITYTAQTTAVLPSGTASQNRVKAIGSRTVGGTAQTFNATDFAFVSSGDLSLTKVSDATTPLYPGNQVQYTVQATTTAGNFTRAAIFDPIPAGTTYVAGSGQVTCSALAQNLRDEFTTALYTGTNGSVTWPAGTPWTETDILVGGAATGLVNAAANKLRLSWAENVRDEFATVAYTNNGPGNTANWATGWAETEPVGGGSAAAGLVQVTGNQLRMGLTENVRDEFASAAYNLNGPGNTRNWNGNWVESDITAPNAATGGFIRVENSALTFGADVTTVLDEFNNNGSYAGNDGNASWNAAWTEANDGGTGAGGGSLRVANNALQFRNANAGRMVTRAATVTGATSATINFAFSVGAGVTGIEAGETVVAEYSIDGAAYVNIGTYDGATGWAWGAGGAVPLNVALLSNTTLSIRFQAPGAWAVGGADTSDRAYVDDVGISCNRPAPAGNQIYRIATLTGSTGATLNFGYAAANLVAGDTLVLDTCTDAACGTVTTLATFTGGVPDVAPPYALPYLGANSTIRLRITGGFAGAGKTLSFDNVDITYQRAFAATQILRSANLAAAADATVEFDYSSTGMGAGDVFLVEACTTTACGTATTLATYTGGVPDTPPPYALPYLVAGATIRFRFTADGGFAGVAKTVFFDNVNISYRRTTSTPSVYRSADLSTAGWVAPRLSFSYSSSNLAAGDTLVLDTCTDAACGTVTTLATFTGGVPNTPPPYALPYTTATTILRFRLTGGFATTNKFFLVDDLDISSLSASSSFASGNPPEFLSSAAGCSVSNANPLTLTFSVTVNTPFPSGQTNITNTALMNTAELPTALTATVTDPVTVPSVLSASVAGNVWHDLDRDGAWDVGEPGLAGVEVTLKDKWGTPLPGMTVLSDANGHYLFSDVAPDTGYYVEVTPDTLPAGLTQTAPAGRSDNRTGSFDLTAGQDLVAENLGYGTDPTKAAFGDQVWSDADGDGVRDPGEVGIDGVTVELYLDDGDGILDTVCDPACDTLAGTTTTDADGSYLFTGATATGSETYFVSATAPSGYTLTSPATSPYYRFQNVTAGASYLTADFGFNNPSTYSITDRVWRDPNFDGVYNSGEGLPGVTVELLDASLHVIATTTTDANGLFVFSGVAGAGADYTVRLNDANGVLADYYGFTTDAQNGYRPETVDAASIVNTTASPYGSFGFRTSRSIGDTVYNDTTGLGIAGVVASLYRDVDGNGSILAAGPGTISVTAGVATGVGTSFLDYHANEPITINGIEYTIASVASNTSLTLTSSPTIGSTAYAAPAPITVTSITVSAGSPTVTGVGTKFTSYRPGEQITINNVPYIILSVASDTSLTLTTNVGAGGAYANYYGPGAPLGTLTTDAYGQYLFSGLADGDYVVSVQTPTGYGYVDHGRTDTDGSFAGTQLGATISGTGSVLDRDFAFAAVTPLDISGIVWDNPDGNTTQGGSEDGIANVTLDILDGATVVATVTTAGDGSYSVSGLASGITYTVRITDTNHALDGYSSNYEKTEQNSPPPTGFNYQESVSASASNINFGYAKPAPTYASIAFLRAFVQDGGVVVEWRTSIEIGTTGFNLLRRDLVSGEFAQINDRLLPALIVHPQGGIYRFTDEDAPLRGQLTYKLVEVEAQGTRREYGPFTVTLGAKSGAPALRNARTPGRKFERIATTVTADRASKLLTRAAERRAAASARAGSTGGTVKITTRGEGLHYVAADTIAPLFGIDAAKAAAMIANRRLQLFNRGVSVPYLPAAAGAGVYFHADLMESIYSGDNAYWLTPGRGAAIAATPSGAGGPTVETFTATAHAEEQRFPLMGFSRDPESDFWIWDYVIGGYPGMDTKSFVISAPASAGAGAATVRVRLVGGSDTAAPADHHVVVLLNGATVGDVVWDGTVGSEVVASVDPALVVDGDNTLEVIAQLGAGVPYSVVFIDSIDLVYQRFFSAVDDKLAFDAPPSASIEISGFSTPQVVLLDVTTPSTPSRVTRAKVVADPDGTYRLRFGTPFGSESRRYAATAYTKARTPVAVSAWSSAGLRDTGNAADYLLIAPDSLKVAAQALADYRTGRGLRTRVVDLDAVYDEFNGGIPSPHAIQEFLRYATAAWTVPPRYAALIGKGTYDYYNYQGYGDNLVPPLLVATDAGLAVSDNRIADLAGDDGVPEIALGRLPVVTAQELLDYLAKVEDYEAVAANPLRVLMAADNPDGGGAYTVDSDLVAGLVPGDYRIDKVYLTNYAAVTGKKAIVDSINAGVSLFNYIGHGGFDRLAHENLFASSDVKLLTNAGRLPVFLAMTCSAGNFGIPGYQSLGETMLLAKDGGMLASWASSGLSYNGSSVILDYGFFRSVFFGGPKKAVGDAVTDALRDYAAAGGDPTMRDVYNLLGEPVSELP